MSDRLRVGDWAWVTQQDGRPYEIPTGTLVEVTEIDGLDHAVPYKAASILRPGYWWFCEGDLQKFYSPKEALDAAPTPPKVEVPKPEGGLPEPR